MQSEKIFSERCLVGRFYFAARSRDLNRRVLTKIIFMKYVNFCLAVVASLMLMSGSVNKSAPSLGYYPGETIPNIALEDSEGNAVNLNDLKGKKVVLNFWAAYDAQSRATNAQLYNYLKENNSDVEFLSVSFDENRNVFEKTLLLDNIDSFSQFCDVNGTESEIYKDFQLKKGFKSYLIDERGVITAMNVTPKTLRTLL